MADDDMDIATLEALLREKQRLLNQLGGSSSNERTSSSQSHCDDATATAHWNGKEPRKRSHKTAIRLLERVPDPISPLRPELLVGRVRPDVAAAACSTPKRQKITLEEPNSTFAARSRTPSAVDEMSHRSTVSAADLSITSSTSSSEMTQTTLNGAPNLLLSPPFSERPTPQNADASLSSDDEPSSDALRSAGDDTGFLSVSEKEDNDISVDPPPLPPTMLLPPPPPTLPDDAAKRTNNEQLASVDMDSDDDSDFDAHEFLEKQVEDTEQSTNQQRTPNPSEQMEQPIMREKTVLKYRTSEFFEVLPNGWIEITHRSGLPVYLHKQSRVCTLARPYFIGPGSVRNHYVPLASVPCLYQRRAREEAEKRREDETQDNANTTVASESSTISNGVANDATEGKCPLSSGASKKGAVVVQTAKDFEGRNLKPDQLLEYARKAFAFETVQVVKFRKWHCARDYYKRKKLIQQAQQSAQNEEGNVEGDLLAVNGLTPGVLGRPTLPSHVKLITVPSLETGPKQRRPFFLNPQGKTSVALLHEYIQKVLKAHIQYKYEETRNASKPYSSTVMIEMPNSTVRNERAQRMRAVLDKLQKVKGGQPLLVSPHKNKQQPAQPEFAVLGTGYGNSKKVAKLDAAKKALEVLVPGLEFNEQGVAAGAFNSNGNVDAEASADDSTIALFDLLSLTDTRVSELSEKAGQPTPFLILQEFLKRHAPFGNTAIDTSTERLKHQRHRFTMSVGKGNHVVKVFCSNKKEGKQKASQAMLAKMNPHIKTWGSLIRLYGSWAQRERQQVKHNKDSIIKLQGSKTGESSEPNQAILDKLKQEMGALFGKLSTTGDGTQKDGRTRVDPKLVMSSEIVKYRNI